MKTPFVLLLALSFSGTTLADFAFGSLAGEDEVGAPNYPAQSSYCSYNIAQEGDSVCSAQDFDPADNSGGCPGQDGTFPNFCGQDIPTASGTIYLASSGDCGATGQAQSASGGFPSGEFYAAIMADFANGPLPIGTCSYGITDKEDCQVALGTGAGQFFIQCETGGGYNVDV